MPALNQIITTDVTLSNLAIDLSKNNYVADKVLPILKSDIKTGKIMRLDSDADAKRKVDTKRAAGSAAKRFDTNVSRPVLFDCEDHALDTGIAYEVYGGIGQVPYAPQVYETQRLMEAISQDKEIALVTAIEAAVTSTTSPGDWNQSSGTPLKDLLTQTDTTAEASGVYPNGIVSSGKIFRAMMATDEVKAAMQYVKMPTLKDFLPYLADYLGFPFENIIVANATLKNTSKKGQTAGFANIWGENCLLFNLSQPSTNYTGLGVTTVWQSGVDGQGSGGVVDGWRVRVWDDQDTESRMVRVGQYYDHVFTNASGAHLFTNTLA